MEENANGFEILHDEARNIVILRIWRLLDAQTGEQCKTAFYEHINRLSACTLRWDLLLDLSACPSQSQDIQNMLGRMLNAARRQGMDRHAVLVKRSLAALNAHPSAMLPVFFYFQSEGAAIQWLKGGQDSP